MLCEPYKSLSANMPKKGLVLDAGCGIFTYTDFLRQSTPNIEVISFDIVNLCPEKACVNNFLLANISDMPFRDNSFEFICCFSVLEFVENYTQAFGEFHRILKKNGKLIVTLPTKLSVFRLLRDLEIFFGVYQLPQCNTKFFHYFNKSDIYFITKKFKLEDLYGYNFNFIPRLMGFFSSLFRKILHKQKYLDKGLVSKPSTSYKINMSSKPSKGNFKSNLLIHALSDLSYHYILILCKQ